MIYNVGEGKGYFEKEKRKIEESFKNEIMRVSLWEYSQGGLR